VNTTSIELLEGITAFEHLVNKQFIQAWLDLYAACPWSTTYQSFGFVESWYLAYRSQFDPLLIFSRTATGLAGLLPLAVDRESRCLTVAGAHQMDYQGWLAAPEYHKSFITSAFDALHKMHPGKSLTFRYLPPGMPVECLALNRSVISRCLLDSGIRPMMRFSGNSASSSLRKKSNKSKLNRLARLGELELIQLDDPEDVDRLLDCIIPFYDLRQGARSGTPPFQSDSNKRQFYRAQARHQGLLHVSVLKAGDTVLAANLGPKERDSVAVGVFAYSPVHAKESPGKFHLLLLSEKLAAEGVPAIDLTPDGDYKERFATDKEPLHVLTVFAHPAARAAALIQRNARRAIRTMVKPVLHRIPSAWNRSRKRSTSSGTSGIVDLYAWGNSRYMGPAMLGLRSGRLADLLEYGADTKPETRASFFAWCLEFLEREYIPYTLLDSSGQLQACAWVSIRNTELDIPGLAHRVRLPVESNTVADLWFARGMNDEERRLFLYSVVTEIGGTLPFYVCVPAEDNLLRKLLNGGGFACSIANDLTSASCLEAP
jgi:CelD/BcsL family acetyltransferase involved in cellulose biosynthesis